MNENPGGSGKQPVNNNNPNFWHFLVIGVLLTFLLNSALASWQDSNKAEIDYSQFVNLVEADLVERVTIESEQLAITLKKDANRDKVTAILKPKEAEAETAETSQATEVAEATPQQQAVQEQLEQLNNALQRNQSYYTGIINDPEFTSRLLAHNVSLSRPVTQTNTLTNFVTSWILPMLFICGIYFFLMRFVMKRMGGGEGMGGFMNMGKSNAKLYNIEKSTGITFADVAGQDEAKESLDEMVDFLHHPDKYQKIGAKQPKGALLVGPPGTGKTLLAKAVAGEAKVPFFSLSGSEFVEMFVGMGAKRVRDLFEQANKQAPCIIFIDEIDAIGKSRDSQLSSNDEREQTLNQLLSEMDGFDGSKGIVILAATNRPEILDKALLRPGRFDRQIIVEKPDLPGREAILKVHVKKVAMGPDVDLANIALATSGATGADLANMINEAALRAVRMGRQAVIQEDLMESVELVFVGKEKKDRVLNKKEKETVAYHEIGHALARALQKDAQPVQKITIIPRTMGALGYVMSMPEEARYLMTKDEMEAEITVMLAGRAAEEIQFGTVTTGASDDIEKATKMARSMVTQYGMSDRFGLMALESTQSKYLDGRNVSLVSDSTGAEVDNEVRKILDRCHAKAAELISGSSQKLTELAAFLIEKETITGKEFMKILKPEQVELEKSPEQEPAEQEPASSDTEELVKQVLTSEGPAPADTPSEEES